MLQYRIYSIIKYYTMAVCFTVSEGLDQGRNQGFIVEGANQAIANFKLKTVYNILKPILEIFQSY